MPEKSFEYKPIKPVQTLCFTAQLHIQEKPLTLNPLHYVFLNFYRVNHKATNKKALDNSALLLQEKKRKKIQQTTATFPAYEI